MTIHIDGLPLFKSSTIQFWPILVDVADNPRYRPMPIGIYCGYGKPEVIEEFLGPLVLELKNILNIGVKISGFQVNVKLKCFICDCPARAYIKGTQEPVKNCALILSESSHFYTEVTM